MKQSLRKYFGAASAIFLIGLFVAAAPVRAASTDERIKALAAELEQLKADQQRVQQEQTQIKQDALAARSKLPSFRYRPGSGLRIRGADRSWEYRVTGEVSVHMSFFPNGGRSPEDSDSDGPTQGGMFGRHFQWGHYARLLNGLYEFGFNIKCDREGGDRCRASSHRATVRFSTWSPYYPDLQVLATSNRLYSRNSRVSSSSGHTFEREPAFTDWLSTGSNKGLGLAWQDVPLGPSSLDATVMYSSGNDQFNAKMDQDPLPQKGVVIGLSLDPLPKSKNKYLKGINLRFNYVNFAEDDNRAGGDNNQMRVRSRTRTNRFTVYSQSTRGRHSYGEVSLDYTVGPFNLAYFWGRHVGEQRRTGGCAAKGSIEGDIGDLEDLEDLGLGTPEITTEIADLTADAAATCNNFSDARMTVNNIAMGAWLWGPKGFMSGSRNGGWRFSYTHNRIYIDAGGGFDADETENEFSSMRRWHYLENIMMLRWYQKRNLTWAIQYEINRISKMVGSGKAAETRRRANILEDGGTYQAITLHTKWIF